MTLSGRTVPKGEGAGIWFVTAVTVQATLLVNVQTWKKMDQDLLVAAVVGEAAEEAVTKEGVFATDVTGLVTSPVNVLKEMQAMREVVDLSATAVIA